jgi:hypothetical protein
MAPRVRAGRSRGWARIRSSRAGVESLLPSDVDEGERLVPEGGSNGNGNGNGSLDGVRPRLVFFTSSRSGRARRVEGFLAAVLQRRRNHETFDVVTVDIDEWPDIAERLGVDSVPVLLVVEEGNVRARLENPPGASAIVGLLEPWLK